MEEIKVSTLIAAIKQAFEQLSSQRGWYQELGLTKTGAGAIMNRFKKGNLSIEKMAELMEAKGITIKIQDQSHVFNIDYDREQYPLTRYNGYLRKAFLRNFKEVAVMSAAGGRVLELFDGHEYTIVPLRELQPDLEKLDKDIEGKTDEEMAELVDLFAIEVYSTWAPLKGNVK